MKTFSVLIILITAVNLIVFGGTQYYRCSYRDDPATTIVIGWCDSGTSTNAKVYYGTTDLGTDYLNYPFNKTIDRTQIYKGLNHQFARLTGLTPNTIYFFVIHDDQGTSVRMSFKTLPDNANTPITFIAGGDSRTGIFTEFEYSQCRPRRQDGNKLVAKIRPSFVAFSGDYVYSVPGVISSTNAVWADWFSDWQLTITPDGQLIPIIPVFGNHELNDDVYNMFDIPDNNTYYSLAIGGNLLRLYTLNTEIDCDATQQSWLANDLQLHTNNTNEPYWKFVQYHYPFVPHSNYSPNTTIINCWASLFEANKVKLVSEAHAHIMKVTWPIVTSSATGSDNGFIRDDLNGIVYIGEGSWGAPMRDLYTYYSPAAAYNWTRNQEKIPGFHLICASKQKIEVRTVKFENVINTGQVMSDDVPCTLPSNLVLWNPDNGSVVTINNPMPLSTDADLLNIATSMGTLNPVFNTATLNYTVQLPSGTTVVPTITATISDPDATIQITQATSLTGTIIESTATVFVTAEDGITTKIYSVQFIVDPSKIQEIIAGKSAILYPNPGNGIFNIEFYTLQKQIEIEVHNAMGKIIKTEKLSDINFYKLDFSRSGNGVYYVYIKNDTLNDTFKVSKIK